MDEQADRRRWVVLAAGFVAITAGCTFQFGLPYLLPHLRAQGLTLPQVGLVVASPSFGLLLTLIAWGAAADRWGERRVLALGLALAVPCLLLATRATSAFGLGACLAAAGAAGACVHAASGRLILGWFAAHERGLAMGLRQTAQPAGVCLAAVVLPGLSTHGTPPVMAFLAALCAIAAVIVVLAVRDAQHAAAGSAGQHSGRSPYGTPVLWRIHTASALLVVPQFTVGAFALAFLVDARGWDAASGGRLLAIGLLGGAAARLGAGWWSDLTGSRTRPLRLVSAGIAASMLALAGSAALGVALTPAVLLAAAVVTVSPNGLAFTAVAEYAGHGWAGRALGIQNTAQNAVATLTPPLVAVLISARGYAPAFGAAVAFPAIACAVVPRLSLGQAAGGSAE